MTTTSPAPRSGPRSALPWALGVVTVIVLALGVVTAAVRGSGSSNNQAVSPPATSTSAGPTTTATSPSPADIAAATVAARDYYGALSRNQSRTAFGLLCTQQQQQGFTHYASTVALDRRTGTGVSGFRLTGATKIVGVAAGVPGVVALADGQQADIIVLVVHQGGAWRVCSSNLGGVLPGPGPSGSGGGSGSGSGSGSGGASST